MPRWRPLPEELDPQIREFTSQLRRLVDRSGMSVAAIADRTGYSKSSWERYLGGRLLPPRGATHALGEVTGTDIRHLETMWELAERAWSRDEMRHDQTMEAIRVAQAREALGEFWDEDPAKGRKWGRNKTKQKHRNKSKDRDGGHVSEGVPARAAGGESAEDGPEQGEKHGEWKEKTGEIPLVGAENSQKRPAGSHLFAPPSASSVTGSRGGAATASASAAAAPAETARPPMDDETAVLRPRPLPGSGHGSGGRGAGRPGGGAAGTGGIPAQRTDVVSWGTPNDRRSGAAKAGRGTGSGPPAYPSGGGGFRTEPSDEGAPDAPGGPLLPDGPGADDPYGDALPGHARAGDAPPGDPLPGDGSSSRGRRVAALLGGALAVFAVLGAGVLFFGLPGGTQNSSASPSPSAKPTPRDLPAGVKCRGKSCSGKDPEQMGCGGQNVKTGPSAFVGPSMVEVRYSEVCKAAWGRITGAAQGDSLKISAGGQAESDKVGETNDAYTEMVAVGSATEARACATLVAGTTGCTKIGEAGQEGAAGSTGGDTEGSAAPGQGDGAVAPGEPGDTGGTTGAASSGTTGTGGTTGTTGTAGNQG